MVRAFATAAVLATALAVSVSGAEAHARPVARAHPAAKVTRSHRDHRRRTVRCPARRAHERRLRHARCPAPAHRAKHTKHKRRLKAHITLVTTGSSRLRQGATTAYSASVSWPAVVGAASTRVYIDGRLTDEFGSDPGNSYVLQGLWPSSNFRVTIELLAPGGSRLAQFARTVTTQPRTGSFPRLYNSAAFINTPIGNAPSVDSNSSAIISSAITSYVNSANLSNNDAWGIPIVTADQQSSTYNVGCQYYWCNVDFGQVHIPTSAQPDTGSDGHLVVLQPNGTEFDMWIGQHTTSGWTAGSRWLESANGPAANCSTVHACGGADAANFALAAGAVRPEEIAQGHIDHALAITTPDTRQGYIACPATNGDGTHASPNALPIGAHLQLDPNINVAALSIPTWEKVIAVALQQYGAYVIDTGGSVALYAQSNLGRPYDAWARAGVPSTSPSLSNLPWHSMRVLPMTQCGT
jgi:hypothetical protein